MVMIEVGNPKTAREMFASAQSSLMQKVEQGGYSGTPHSAYDILMMQSIINQLDEHRPLGNDGKHGDLHTETCGCSDKPDWPEKEAVSEPKYQARPDIVLPSLMASQRHTGLARRCFWCGVGLRWWQLRGCRRCSFSMRMNTPSSPCPEGSRWNAEPDFWQLSFATPYSKTRWRNGE